MLYNKQPETFSNAQKLAKFLNEDLNLRPAKVNTMLELLRDQFPEIMWDIPTEQ